MKFAVSVAAICLVGLAPSAQAATVTNADDTGPGSLRAAIAAAPAGETIDFHPDLNGETIDLTSGAIAIDRSLTIAGPGAAQLTIDAGHNSQIFTVTAGNLEISGLTLADGAAPVNGGAISHSSNGSLSVSDCAFDGNTAGGDGGSGSLSGWGDGGAIYVATSAGSLVVVGSAFTANTAGGDGGSGDYSGQGRGGAIRYDGEGSLSVTESAFDANTVGGAGAGGEASGAGSGGAIYISTRTMSTSISDSEFIDNSAGGSGDAGFNSGHASGGAINHTSGATMTVSGSSFAGNTVGGAGGDGGNGGAGSGGAISNSSGTLTVTNSAFSANTVGGEGGVGSGSGDGLAGAIYTGFRTLTVTGSTFSVNTTGGPGGPLDKGGAGRGGAIYATAADLSITNSTLVGNKAGGAGTKGSGGAIQMTTTSSAVLTSVTVSGNSVGTVDASGAGINASTLPAATTIPVTARATIISGNTGASNCYKPVASSTYSLEGPSAGDTSCGFHHLPSADPELQALNDNGGPTETQALPETSPAVGVVPAAHCPTSVDQRGEPRPDHGKPFCDAGAYELQGPFVAPQITSEETANFQVGKAASFTVTATGVPRPSLSHAGALPTGVTFTDNGDGTASLAGTPAGGSEGSWPITIEAANGTAPDATQDFTLLVAALDPPLGPIDPPDCPAPLTTTVAPCPDGPGEPQEPSPRPLALSLALERKSLGKLLRSGRLVVAARVNRAAELALVGRARVRPASHRTAQPRFVAVFQRRTVIFGAPGGKRVALVLTRQGRRALRDLHRVRLAIAGTARDAAGEAASRSLVVTLRR